MSCSSCNSSVPHPPSVGEDGEHPEFPSGSTNPCKLCTPLGACLAFKGIAGAVPLLHGSQGCATYIRRYLISHFREPVDIASTNFSEDSAVFGGRKNLHTALDNVGRQYRPALVGVATTCLSETMGENMPLLIGEYLKECGLRSADCGTAGAADGAMVGNGSSAGIVPFASGSESIRNPQSAIRIPELVHVSTPSYKGTHAAGFHAAVRALVETLAGTSAPETQNPKLETGGAPLALFPGMVSPADLRHLRDFCAAWGVAITLVPDYAETLDGPSWAEFERMPAGGTTIEELRALDRAAAALEFGHSLAAAPATAGTHLRDKFQVALHRLGLPIGVRANDAFCAALSAACPNVEASLLAMGDSESPASRLLQGKPLFCTVVDSSGRELRLPPRVAAERGRLIDSYVDAHKYLAGKKAVVYGEDDLVAGLAVFLAETGITPVLVASGERNRRLGEAIYAAAPELRGRIEVREGSDFGDVETRIDELKPDLLIGSSKGYKLARTLNVPLVRCGFPVHDRLGAQRLQLLGYAGTQQLFDRIVNALLEAKQEHSDIGYSYL
ncbi:MAG: nitrogenase component 1 [Opitutaceae bacterium]